MAETLDTEMETLKEPINGTPETLNSSSSDSDSEDEAQEALNLEALEKQLAEEPLNYQAHVDYIASLRKLGLIEKLHQARESMSELFPLTPKLWQEWAKDEAALSNGNEAFIAIEKLYERGLHDYLSVPLWCDYIEFVQVHDPIVRGYSQDGISKMRDLMEHALSSGGLHVAEGNRIWAAYIAFEQSIYHSFDDNHTEEKEKQAQRIRSLFHRQLSVPLNDSTSALVAYKAWEVEQGNTPETSSNNFDEIPSQVASAYQKAIEMFNARTFYEEHISRQDAPAERLQHFMTYIKFEESSGNPARVQILYERAVTEFPTEWNLWLDYIRYLTQTLKVPKVVMDVCSRATRNYPWIGELWVQYLLSLERAHANETELSTVFEQSLQYTFSSFEEYLELFLTRIDGFRRRICLTGSTEDVLDYAVIRETFQRAADYLSPNLKNTDALLRLYAYWARLELNLGKDVVAARGVWESCLKTCGSMFEACKQYIGMEIETGHIDEARSIYKRCYSKRFSGYSSEDICHSWLRFEREFGTLEDYDHTVKKVAPRLEEVQLFRYQQESKSVTASGDQKVDPISAKVPLKRKMGARATEEHPTPKRPKSSALPTPKRPKSSALKATGSFDANPKSTDRNNKSPKPVDKLVDKPESTNEQQTKHASSKESYRDECTAFLSNLSLQAKEEHLRDFFSDVGGVTAIRLLKDKFTGKPRGLAYVDFTDDEHLAEAVAKNKKTFLGKKVSIARSDPKRSNRKESTGRNTTEHGKEMRPVEGSDSRGRGGDVQLKGKNTFVPRAVVRPLGWSANEPKKKQQVEETLKSNDEFRKMLQKK